MRCFHCFVATALHISSLIHGKISSTQESAILVRGLRPGGLRIKFPISKSLGLDKLTWKMLAIERFIFFDLFFYFYFFARNLLCESAIPLPPQFFVGFVFIYFVFFGCCFCLFGGIVFTFFYIG